MTEFLNSLGPLSFVGFIILQAIQVIAAPIPGEVTGFIGGYLYGIVIGIVLSTIGLTIGSWVAFTLSRVLGRPFVEKFIKKKTIERYDYLLHHKGAFLVFLLFLIPGFPKDSLCYILGLGHLTTKEFLIISTVGRFAGTVLLTLGEVIYTTSSITGFYTSGRCCRCGFYQWHIKTSLKGFSEYGMLPQEGRQGGQKKVESKKLPYLIEGFHFICICTVFFVYVQGFSIFISDLPFLLPLRAPSLPLS